MNTFEHKFQFINLNILIMSQFEEKVSEMLSEATKLGWTVNEDLLTKIAKGLGPSIYNTDSSLVSSSDQAELDRVKQNFLIGKLGCAEDESLDQAIDEVVNAFGSSNRNKHRILFYYQLVVKLGKESVYN